MNLLYTLPFVVFAGPDKNVSKDKFWSSRKKTKTALQLLGVLGQGEKTMENRCPHSLRVLSGLQSDFSHSRQDKFVGGTRVCAC